MRIWVDPDRLAGMNLNASDVANAVREQNSQVACGQIGQEPIRKGQQTQITLSTLGRLVEPEQFANIVVKRTGRGPNRPDQGHRPRRARRAEHGCRPTSSTAIPARTSACFNCPTPMPWTRPTACRQ